MGFVSEEIKSYILEQYKDFHKNPELAGGEDRTCKKIKSELDKMGITYQEIDKTCVVADIKGKSDKKILLCADINADMADEKTEAEFKSATPGVMHASGNDACMAALLGAAKIFSGMDNLEGTIRLLFESSDADAEASKRLIEGGILKDVESAFYIQLAPDLPLGTVSVESGARMAAFDKFEIKIRPENVYNFTYSLYDKENFGHILAGASILTNIFEITSFEKNPLEPAFISVKDFNTSGTNGSKETIIKGGIRYFNLELSKFYSELIGRIMDNAAKSFKSEAELCYKKCTQPLVNDDFCSVIATNSATQLFGKEGIVSKPKTMDSKEFANYLAEVPGLVAFVGTSNGSDETIFPLGSEFFGIDENATIHCADLFVQYALDYFGFAE